MLHPLSHLSSCGVCPRNCHVNRLKGETGYCHGTALPKIALVSTHQWEEPPISGTKGSGTIFFSNCNLSCVFCQNHTISQEGYGISVTIQRLADIFLEQQDKGVHNINLVSATQYIPQVVTALTLAKKHGLTLPVVYNTNGYESLEGLSLLDGLVDVYLPDIKYFHNSLGETYSNCPQYFETTTNAILEMKRQTGNPIFSKTGMMEKGLLIRHLVLPSHYKDSFRILDWIAENIGTDAYVSLLNQYTPMYHACDFPKINRHLTTYEYEKVTDYFLKIGLKNGYVQKRSSATTAYTPIFDGTGVTKEEK